MKKKKSKQTNNVSFENSKTKFKASQLANATVAQGGNAFAINANELGIIRIRPGQ
ncbi:hypothetical protein ACFOLF_02835 [Paenibacillus sepulcri]|uniref:Uncharacterized protein n=1 Tax=Paenibacillus sepulcri TaxID=359917 RepID=A0ABS7CEG0_9BACL|nr:hypothetical protein [Paenibacillus sepulcri]